MNRRRSYQGSWYPAGILLVGLLAGCSGDGSSGNGPASSREGPASTSAVKKYSETDLRNSQDKLKKIGEAMLGKFYETCPAGYADRKRKPLLSWRVALLPRLGREDLLKRFHLLEPWDSPTNLKLLPDMPEVFRPVRGKAKEGYTYYQGFVGPETVFPAQADTGLPVDSREPKSYATRHLAQILDGTSYTFLIVEGGEAVPWTRPDELFYDSKKPLPRLGGQFDGDVNALFCDGTVRLIPRTAPEKLVRALATSAGGEKVDLREIGLTDPIAGPPGGTDPRSTRADVQGTITYKGLPLGGGTVSFRTEGGKDFAAGITANGTYFLAQVPAGVCKVSVETESCKNAPRGGTYVRIPQKYGRVETSGLVCEVKGGDTRTIDIQLQE